MQDCRLKPIINSPFYNLHQHKIAVAPLKGGVPVLVNYSERLLYLGQKTQFLEWQKKKKKKKNCNPSSHCTEVDTNRNCTPVDEKYCLMYRFSLIIKMSQISAYSSLSLILLSYSIKQYLPSVTHGKILALNYCVLCTIVHACVTLGEYYFCVVIQQQACRKV